MAVLCSARAPGLETLLDRSMVAGAPYRVVSCVSSDRVCGEVDLLSARGVPMRTLDIHAHYEERGAPIGDLRVRRGFDRRVLAALAREAPDAVLLCGYLYVATDVILDAFQGRVFNIHHADLTLTGPDGRPRYTGLRAVRDAIRAGEPETRSTVHVATARVDEGPLLARSRAFPVHPLAADARRRGRDDVLRAYAYAHREWMMASSWGDLLDRALRRVARGEVDATPPAASAGVVARGRP